MLTSMLRRLVFASLTVGACAPATTPPPSDALASSLAGKTILWIGAHPDDESVVSPLFADVCRERGARCTLFVATRGDAGECGRAGGCAPDLATVRVAEMQRAAAVLGARVIQWDLPDVATGTTQDVAARWSAHAGSTEALRAAFLAAVAPVRPDFVFAFDDRHGSTCHPAHRASAGFAGMLLAAGVVTAAQIYLAESRFDIRPDLSSIGYVSAIATNERAQYNGDILLATARKTAWEVMIDGLRAHESQFDARKIAAFAAAPTAQRRVFFASLPEALANANAPGSRFCGD
jgi:LmbE family N-acetylglucosaminyl deacetylase